MKNKKNIYILAPAVLIIWGLLIYKVVAGLNPSVPEAKQIEQLGQFSPKEFEEAESFTISNDYRDPFLGTFEKKKRTKRRTKPTVQEPETPFPSVIYKGIISPKGKNEKVFLVQINGNQHLFKKNNIFDSVKLLKGNAKEITLKFEKQTQTFQLKK